ncbi:hypothetical protein ONS95_003157 [Cadophora gregata]|uniref:uncharacterized protein n=1 Tax=Cadophora gregata TaxID=51156 RepID=UPI0026DB0F46|nr:uncharacterized protein ONS95_003157 [Cadophora gregata]KAK0108342.1 hypothetical protein ONS95_003157 [Cadophora gregata]
MAADRSRLSFAKVAASAGKDTMSSYANAKVAAGNPIRDRDRDPRKENIPAPVQEGMEDDVGQLGISTYRKSSASEIAPIHLGGGSFSEAENVQEQPDASVKGAHVPAGLRPEPSITEAKLVDAVKALQVSSPMPSLVVNGSGVGSTKAKPDGMEPFSEDLFQRTDSGSELGTKPPSLDGKSITSGTTFALDEKESLRPDDSASVKAAEDDDTFSGRGSIVAGGSRIGSEASRAYRAQFYEAPERRSMQPMQERQSQGVHTPQSGSSSQQTTDDGKSKPLLVGPTGAPDGFSLFYRQTPDEKLLEALESPKDRIFLLRLEQDVIEFVKDSKEPFIDLPPCNSFCRMLTHKLADYYHMTHQVDAIAGAVRIFRTPFCRLPPSLTSISNPPTTGNTPPPTIPTMKIMRRGGDGDTGPSPSKATSETGSDGKDKNLSAKEKLSREEREAAYNKARERIFGKEENTGDAIPDTEDVNEMSRSSSVSTKDRAPQNKRPKVPKQRRDDSESFDRRSQYTPFFPQPPVPTWVPQPQYPTVPTQPFNGTVQNNYQAVIPPFVQPVQQYSQNMMSNGNMQQYNSMAQQYPQRYQHHSAPITTYGTPVQSPQIPVQQWQQQQQPLYQNQTPYQPQAPVRGPPSSIPYAFGQLPSTINPADPKSQHPIPGSFNRHAFNPKTQSFVPNNPGLPIPQPMSHHGSPHQGSPHHGSPHLPYTGYAPPQPQYGNGMGYNMARQGSNNSLPSYHASPHMAHRPMMQQNVSQGLPSGLPHGTQGLHQSLPQGMHIIQGGQVGTHLPHYGNPSTLPPKPKSGV